MCIVQPDTFVKVGHHTWAKWADWFWRQMYFLTRRVWTPAVSEAAQAHFPVLSLRTARVCSRGAGTGVQRPVLQSQRAIRWPGPPCSPEEPPLRAAGETKGSAASAPPTPAAGRPPAAPPRLREGGRGLFRTADRPGRPGSRGWLLSETSQWCTSLFLRWEFYSLREGSRKRTETLTGLRVSTKQRWAHRVI